ncbi:MAG: hypothetical protein ACR2QF_06120 [Geminicoccaceae bacterium]
MVTASAAHMPGSEIMDGQFLHGATVILSADGQHYLFKKPLYFSEHAEKSNVQGKNAG